MAVSIDCEDEVSGHQAVAVASSSSSSLARGRGKHGEVPRGSGGDGFRVAPVRVSSHGGPLNIFFEDSEAEAQDWLGPYLPPMLVIAEDGFTVEGARHSTTAPCPDLRCSQFRLRYGNRVTFL
ncbi:unnamed protein product [Lampetra fluviatilis]